MRTSEVLNTAADLIEERGWTTGTWGSGDDPLCIEGAIAVAMGAGGTPDERMFVVEGCPAVEAVSDYLGGGTPFRWNDVLAHDRITASYNDPSDHRSLEERQAWAASEAAAEVIEVLRAAALVEHAKEQVSA